MRWNTQFVSALLPPDLSHAVKVMLLYSHANLSFSFTLIKRFARSTRKHVHYPTFLSIDIARCGHNIKKVGPLAKRTPEFKRAHYFDLETIFSTIPYGLDGSGWSIS